MNNSLNGQYTCFIDHQPLLSYSLETDRGKKSFFIYLFLFFVKHDLKGVLKCIRVKIWTLPPPPTDRDRHY
jgi:hypothetical protein